MKRSITYIGLGILALALAACGNVASDQHDSFAAPASPVATGTPPVGPISGTVTFPQDEAPHDALTEWWYYTGHLDATDGTHYGFEFVIFQVLRGDNPPYYASHFAITDIDRNGFHFDQRSAVGAKFTPNSPNGFNLALGDWTLHGLNGHDSIAAAFADKSQSLNISLTDTKGPLLEGGTGLVSFGGAGQSYYYSRPRMAISGTLTDGGTQKQVTGLAWFDHQWGNFVSLQGGWDWFSTQLSDGSDLMVQNLLADGKRYSAYGTLRTPDGKTVELKTGDYTITATEQWTSPATHITYPSGWDVVVTADAARNIPALRLHYSPQIKNQELTTADSTGVTYWEGATTVTGTTNGAPVTALSYVELTGYDHK